jgi:hypothetical protein
MSPNIAIAENDLLGLIEGALNADYTAVRQVCNRIAKDCLAVSPEISKRIKLATRRNGVPLRASGYSESLPIDPKSKGALVEEMSWPSSPIFLNSALKHTFDSFVASVKKYDLLAQHGLSGRMNLLMAGPPGTGKTLVAGHIAAALGMPLYVVRLDSLISSLLGDTAKNIRSVFDFIPQKNGIIFLDEFDAIGKLRNDSHEMGELKRVVNTLIQSIDSLDDQAIVIAATNHSELLDRAIWRRFPYRMNFGTPDDDLRKHLWNYFLFCDDGDSGTINALAKISADLSGADIESISLAARRHALITGSKIDIHQVAKDILHPKMDNETLDKKKICNMLHRNYDLSQTEILTLIKVSRQTLSTYLKD